MIRLGKYIISVAILAMIPLNSFAFDNTISFTPGFKVSEDAVAPVIALEYERKIIPLTTAYVKYGSASLTFEGDEGDVDTDFTNFAFGARYNVLFFYVGAGYESTSVSFENSLYGNADGTISGFLVEIDSVTLGPVSLGYSYGLQFANVDVDYDSDVSTFYELPYEDGDTTLHRFEVSAGIRF